MLLTAQQIIEAADLTDELVEVPEWGGAVKIRGFSKAKQQELREAARGANGAVDTERLEVLMLIHGVVEPAIGAEMYEVLRQKSARAVDRILSAILTLNGMTEEAADAAKRRFPPGA